MGARIDARVDVSTRTKERTDGQKLVSWGPLNTSFHTCFMLALEGCAGCVTARVPCQFTVRVNYINNPDYIWKPTFLKNNR